jgi:hypothetical protein
MNLANRLISSKWFIIIVMLCLSIICYLYLVRFATEGTHSGIQTDILPPHEIDWPTLNAVTLQEDRNKELSNQVVDSIRIRVTSVQI